MAVCGLVAVLAGVFTAAFKRRLARSFVENESLNRLEQERSFECLLERMGLGMIFVGAVVIVTTSLSADGIAPGVHSLTLVHISDASPLMRSVEGASTIGRTCCDNVGPMGRVDGNAHYSSGCSVRRGRSPG